MSSKTNKLQHFFRSAPAACPYLEGETESKLFTHLDPENATEINGTLTSIGFRRSHGIVYRPACLACNACIPVRIPIASYVFSRSERRLLSRNEDLTLSTQPAAATQEQYHLFRRYQEDRHGGGDMARMLMEDYRAMIEDTPTQTIFYEFRSPQAKLLGAMLVDGIEDGISAVYSFFDPDEPRRSLGTYMILAAIEQLRPGTGKHIYLGYWIRNCSKMAYKNRFRPLEALGPNGWEPLIQDKLERSIP